jgi:hypothetical protein
MSAKPKGKMAPFGLVPLEMFADKRLTREDIAVYAALAYRQGHNESMWASLGKLAADLKMNTEHRKNLYRHLKKLINSGWVASGQIDPRFGTRHYSVLVPFEDVEEGVSGLKPGGIRAETQGVSGLKPGGIRAETQGVSGLKPKVIREVSQVTNHLSNRATDDNFAELDKIIYGKE